MVRSHPVVKAAAFVLLIFAATQCADQGALEPDDTGSTSTGGFVVSDATLISASALGRDLHAAARAEESVVYVSLPPNTLDRALQVQVDNTTQKGSSTLIEVVRGGFDPHPIAAVAGDVLQFTPLGDGAGAPVMTKVPAKRPPSIVRVNPPKGRTSVPLNVIITIVFTEPINRNTVDESSVKLLRNGVEVASDVELLQDTWTVSLTPQASLDRESNYEIAVSGSVRDVDGDLLSESYASTFVTGTSECEGLESDTTCPLVSGQGNNLLTGLVFERTPDGKQPVAGAMVQGWVQFPDGTGYSRGRVMSDANGRYTMGGLPTAKVQLLATLGTFDQPCAVVVDVSDRSAVGDIEVIRPEKQPLDALRLTPKRLHGFVMEILEPLVGRGVPGARAYFESRPGVVAATATSSAISATTDTEFEMCNLPTFGEMKMTVIKTGLKPLQQVIELRGELTQIQFNMTK